MSVDMEITRKSWSEVPEETKRPLGELISELQFALLYEFGIVQHGEGINDTNDNGTWPVIDIEVHTETDPDGSSRRLIIADDKDILLYHTKKYPGTEGSGKDKPDWKAMCSSLWWSVEEGDGHGLEHNMDYIKPFIKQEEE